MSVSKSCFKPKKKENTLIKKPHVEINIDKITLLLENHINTHTVGHINTLLATTPCKETSKSKFQTNITT